MEDLKVVSFKIISNVGAAKSLYIEALIHAKAYNFELAKKSIEEGDEYFLQGHKAHASLIQKEASGDKLEMNLLLVHAEDQLMSAETIKILSNEFIDVYSRLKALEEK